MKKTLIENLTTIANTEDNSDLIRQGILGKLGTETQDYLNSKYSSISIDNRLHPDDDFEKIEEILNDQIVNDYGNQQNKSIKLK